MTHQPTRSAALDIVAHGSLGLMAGLAAAFFPVLATRMGASAWLLALIASAPYLADLLAPAWVSLAQEWGIRWLMAGSLLLSVPVLVVTGMARSPLSFTLLVLLYFLLYGVGLPWERCSSTSGVPQQSSSLPASSSSLACPCCPLSWPRSKPRP